MVPVYATRVIRWSTIQILSFWPLISIPQCDAPVRRNVIVVGGTCSGIHLLWIRELCFNSDFIFPGKTSLVSVFLGKEFPTDLTATVLDTYIAQVELDGRLVVLALQDTSGGESFEGVRHLTYPGSHVILICYSVDSPSDLNGVEEKVRTTQNCGIQN